MDFKVIEYSEYRRMIRQLTYHVAALWLAGGYALATGMVHFGH